VLVVVQGRRPVDPDVVLGVVPGRLVPGPGLGRPVQVLAGRERVGVGRPAAGAAPAAAAGVEVAPRVDDEVVAVRARAVGRAEPPPRAERVTVERVTVERVTVERVTVERVTVERVTRLAPVAVVGVERITWVAWVAWVAWGSWGWCSRPRAG
jgi:hypothetical protein